MWIASVFEPPDRTSPYYYFVDYRKLFFFVTKLIIIIIMINPFAAIINVMMMRKTNELKLITLIKCRKNVYLLFSIR